MSEPIQPSHLDVPEVLYAVSLVVGQCLADERVDGAAVGVTHLDSDVLVAAALVAQLDGQVASCRGEGTCCDAGR